MRLVLSSTLVASSDGRQPAKACLSSEHVPGFTLCFRIERADALFFRSRRCGAETRSGVGFGEKRKISESMRRSHGNANKQEGRKEEMTFASSDWYDSRSECRANDWPHCRFRFVQERASSNQIESQGWRGAVSALTLRVHGKSSTMDSVCTCSNENKNSFPLRTRFPRVDAKHVNAASVFTHG